MCRLANSCISKYRKLRKYTQEELARKLNISFQAVSKWETGQSLPDVSIIAPPPEDEPVSFFWKSGEMFTYYTDWLLHEAGEMIFDCDSSGIPHRHCIDHMIAEKVV